MLVNPSLTPLCSQTNLHMRSFILSFHPTVSWQFYYLLMEGQPMLHTDIVVNNETLIYMVVP